MVTSQIINENLANRRSHRLQPCERSGSDENPELFTPPTGEWSGEYQDAPCFANSEYKVHCNVIFKADGFVEGSGSSTEGKFCIKGVYNLRSGIVAWRQIFSDNGSRVAAEFFGEVTMYQGTAQITGTFLSSKGRYCVMKLASASEIVANTAALPTLLTRSTCQLKDDKDGQLMPIKNVTAFIATSTGSTSGQDGSVDVSCEMKWESVHHGLVSTLASEEQANGIREVSSQIDVERSLAADQSVLAGSMLEVDEKEDEAGGFVFSRMDSEMNVIAAHPVLVDADLMEKEECGMQGMSPLMHSELKMEVATVFADNGTEMQADEAAQQETASKMNSKSHMEAAFAVFADSEAEEEEPCASARREASCMDSKTHIEAAFAVFADSESEEE